MLAFSRTRQLGSVAAIAVLSLAAALAAQTPQQTPRWKTFSYPADGFTASWPSEPAMSRQNVPTDTGTFELRSYLVDNDPVGMMVGVCDYGAAAAGRDPDSVLQREPGTVRSRTQRPICSASGRSLWARTTEWNSSPRTIRFI